MDFETFWSLLVGRGLQNAFCLHVEIRTPKKKNLGMHNFKWEKVAEFSENSRNETIHISYVVVTINLSSSLSILRKKKSSNV